MPYGLTYQGLSELQDIKEEDLIPIPKTTMFLMILKVIPLPSDSMLVGEAQISEPYYYFAANAAKLPVTRLVEGPPLLHMALRPFKSIPNIQYPLFDKSYTYVNDSLYFQVHSLFAFDSTPNPHEVTKISLTTKKWLGDRVTPLVEYVTLPNYSTVSDEVVPSASDLSAEVTKLAEEMKNDMTQTRDNTPITSQAADNANPEKVVETIVAEGVAITGKSIVNPE